MRRLISSSALISRQTIQSLSSSDTVTVITKFSTISGGITRLRVRVHKYSSRFLVHRLERGRYTRLNCTVQSFLALPSRYRPLRGHCRIYIQVKRNERYAKKQSAKLRVSIQAMHRRRASRQHHTATPHHTTQLSVLVNTYSIIYVAILNDNEKRFYKYPT
jgi:hypothetical protein